MRQGQPRRSLQTDGEKVTGRPDLRLKIAGIGRYLPTRVVSSDEVAQLCGLPRGWIEEHGGVSQRRWARPEDGETNSWMGARAAEAAIVDAGVALADIDLILNASGTVEQAIPDGGPLLQRELGAQTSGIPCASVHSTCLSFLTALETSASHLELGLYRRILVVCSEISSCGLDFADPESSALFGDAACAVVLTRATEDEASRLHALRMETYSSGADWTTIRGAGTRRHPNHPATRKEDNLFHMDGPELLKQALKTMPGFLDRLWARITSDSSDIALVIPHQTSLAGLRAHRRVGFPDEKVVQTLDQYGNCIAASMPLTLHEAIRDGRLSRGDRFLLLGTGAGLSFGGAILTY